MDVRTYVEANASGFFTELKEWLAIPSISADPARRDDVRKSAGWLAARLRATRPTAGIEAGVTLGGPGARASHSPIGSPAVRAARRALGRAFGRDILFTREGGSGPEADRAGTLGAPLVFVAVGLDSDRIHAPNEKAERGLLLTGAETAAYLWEELAATELGSAAEPRP